MGFGLVVTPRFLPSADELALLRPAFLRSIVYSLDDVDALVATGWPILLTVNNEMQEVGGWATWDQAIQGIADRARGKVFAVCVGNEFDIWWKDNPADVPPAFAADLVKRAARILRPHGIKTVATSVAGPKWQEYLAEMADLCRDDADWFDLHAYGQNPDGFKPPGTWMHGDLRPALIRAREIAQKPVIMSEYGCKIGDAGGEDQVAAFLAAAASTIAALGPDVCPHAAWFAWRDEVGAPSERGPQAFGLVAEDGRRRPAWQAFAALVDAPPADPDPPVDAPEDEIRRGIAVDLAYDTHRDPDAFVASLEERFAGTSYSPVVYQRLAAAARSGEAWTGGPTTVTAPLPARVTFNKDEPAIPQNDQWSCAPTSLRWALKAVGRNPTEQWIEDTMLAEGVVSKDLGLLDGTGRWLADFVTRQYDEFGYYANHDPAVTFDDVTAEFGPYPLLIGGRNWGGAGLGHWSGVRGYDGNVGLLLANPADGYGGVHQTLNRQQWAAAGPFSMVRVLHDDLIPEELPPPPPPPPAPDPRLRQRVLIVEIGERLAELSSLVG